MLGEYYDYSTMGNEIAMKMMVVHRVKEPTLNQVQQNCGKNGESCKPAWITNAEAHPGLPDHYLAASGLLSGQADENYVNLPHVNREIDSKLLIVPWIKPKARKTNKLPTLSALLNGTIVVVGDALPNERPEQNVEIFLSVHEKLLPCCYAQRSEIIYDSPSTLQGRVRCYFIHEPSATARGVSFFSSEGQVLLQTPNYHIKWFYGSTPYKFLHL